MKRLIAALFLLVLSLPVLAADYPARVVGVTDGDTLTVLTAEKKQVKVRLHGIDAPETGQDFGSRAKQAASEMAFGLQVTVRELDWDRYGRTVAEVILPDGRSLNREMLRGGTAWWYRAYAPVDHELASLEAEAKAAKRGLWAQPGAVPPWDWRKGKGVPATEEVVGNRRSHLYHAPQLPGRGLDEREEPGHVQDGGRGRGGGLLEGGGLPVNTLISRIKRTVNCQLRLNLAFL
jgi:endonuclease YncB( thermonuclease family)